MLPTLSQAAADATTTTSLSSTVSILAATFLLTAIAKQLVGFKGKVTLVVSLVISSALTALAIYGTKTLDANIFDALLVVLAGVAGAAGIDASGKALFSKATPPVILLCLMLPLAGCSGVPGSLVVGHVDAVSPDHLARLAAAAEDPPRAIPATQAEVDTYAANWAAIREAGVSAKEGAR